MRCTSYTDLGAVDSQRSTAVAGVQHPVVQSLEVMGSQPAEPGGAEGGEDVALGLVYVAAIGAGGQGELLAGQPLPCQVGAEGERTDVIVASVAFRCDSGGEPFRLGSIGSGGMPGPSLPAGDRVEPFVDDGVVAASLGCDVALHDGVPFVHRIRAIRWNDR